jgi:preprotein translocase subunit SecE
LSRRTELGWPHAILLGMLLVVLVNVAFIYIAVSGADQVVSSYVTEHR